MSTGQPSTQIDKGIIFVAVCLAMGILLALGSLLLLSTQPFLFLSVMALGMMVGVLHARRRYQVWSPVVTANRSQPEVKWYVGLSLLAGSLFLLVSPIIANRLVEPLKTIFLSILLGALAGYLVGYYLWLVGLYVNRHKAKSG